MMSLRHILFVAIAGTGCTSTLPQPRSSALAAPSQKETRQKKAELFAAEVSCTSSYPISPRDLDSAEQLANRGKYEEAKSLLNNNFSAAAVRLSRRIDNMAVEAERRKLDKKLSFYYRVKFFNSNTAEEAVRGDSYQCNKVLSQPPDRIVIADWNPPPNYWKANHIDAGKTVGTIAITDGSRIQIGHIVSYETEDDRNYLQCYVPNIWQSIWAWDKDELCRTIKKRLAYSPLQEN